MADLLGFDKGKSLKEQFRSFDRVSAVQPVEGVVEASKGATTIGHGLYLIYRHERTKQGFDEFKFESMSEAQRLVWERLAAAIGLRLT